MHNALFEQLNQLAPSPGTTPANGPAFDRSDVALSFPCDSSALQAQLEAWTNVAFDFDSPSDDAPLSASSPGLHDAKHLQNAFAAFPAAAPFGHGNDASAQSASSSSVDLNAFLGGSATSLVDPALSLPPFAHPGHALPDAFFVAPGVGGAAAAAASQQVEPATLSPAEMTAASTPAETTSVAAAKEPSPARASRGSASASAGTSKKASGSSSGPARKKRASSSSAAALPVAAASSASATPIVKAGSVSSEASTPAGGKVVALPLPEGIDPKGLNDEDLNRLAIEEDKRRRNTAASARFRVKKKQREQALEIEAKELRERVAVLEKEVDTLKTENGWLRGLITDKHIDLGMSGADNNRKRKRVDGESTALDSSILV
ncbi:hypothetical protein JCM10908_005331 [Rhodotorula pacifica]|uniref:bZIP transcription factor n=1 Tax=Rhodotorula pacifica TaxID=1495444 RepID=UPI00317A0321